MLSFVFLAFLWHGTVSNPLTHAGIAGVLVSNGSAMVLTDARGRYELPAAGDFVFLIQPGGWQVRASADHVPQFYRRAGDEVERVTLNTLSRSAGTADFELTPVPDPENFSALVFTDPQPASPREVSYLDRGLARPLAAAHASDQYLFGITLGDVTYDRPDLYPAITAALGQIGIPWFSVNGNHDLNLGSAGEGAVAPYEAAFGPSTYAFYRGHALFIAINDVRHQAGPRYLGGLRPDQWDFLTALLNHTPKDTLVVPFFHIPLFSPDPSNAETFRWTDRARLFALLRDRPHVLLLSGHTHYVRHVFYGAAEGWNGSAPLHEANVAAACGGFWGGPLDAEGLPIATMSDGTPPGYAVLTVHGTTAQIAYRPGRPQPGGRDQLALHVPDVIAPKQGYVSFYANVYDGHDGWTVEARVDQRGWLPLKRVLGWDPTYAAAYLAQDRATAPPSTPRLPDPTICYHLWRAFLPGDLAIGKHLLTVRASSPDGPTFSASQSFELK
jgi:hypothetical protein